MGQPPFNVLWRVLLFETGKSGKRVETQNEKPALPLGLKPSGKAGYASVI
jgi:hypothetical protein